MSQDHKAVIPPPVLHLPIPTQLDLHPNALKRYVEFLTELLEGVLTLYQCSDEDLRAFLTDSEYAKLSACQAEVSKWLAESSKDQTGSEFRAYQTPFFTMSDIKELLELMVRRKILFDRRKAALREMSPPFDNAQKYLSGEEYHNFIDSLCGAADAYLDGGKGCLLNDWRFDQRAGGYLVWTNVVEKRKREEASYKRAELEYSQFLKEFSDTTNGFKQQLAKEKNPNFAYPLALAEYHPDLWCELELPTRQEVEKWARPQIQQKLPPLLRSFIAWDLEWWAQRLPGAKYQVLGVPCLTWSFLLRVLVKVHLILVEKRFTKEYYGYRYDLMTVPEELGSFYLGPMDWVEREGFSTPIVVLSLLSAGKLESDGIEIVEHERSSTILRLRGYADDFVEVKEHFRNFIVDLAKEKGLAQGLRAKGVIDEVTARLVEQKANLSLPPGSAPEPSLEESTADVISALEAMGYKKGELKVAIKASQFLPGMSLEEKVKTVLKILGT